MAVPELISVNDYIAEVKDDIDSPISSSFALRMQACKNTVADLEEHLEKDRDGLHHMKKTVKKVYSQGQSFVTSELEVSDALDKLGNSGWWPDDNALQEACGKFARIIREHAQLLQTLITNQRNNMIFTLDSVLKGELKGVKGDLKRPFEKAAKDYDVKFAKLEKERKHRAKESGYIKYYLDPQEVTEDLSKERKAFQYEMCEFLIKVNAVKSKKGVGFLQKLVAYYQAYCKYFEEGMKTWAHFGTYVSELSEKLKDAAMEQEQEKTSLKQTRDLINSSIISDDAKTEVACGGASGGVYNLHQQQGDKTHGTSKSGYLYKKSEGKVRKVWQKRRCEVIKEKLLIHHADENKSPVVVPLLTCQVKTSTEDKKCFNLVSYNRTYHLMGEDESDTAAWVSVLLNSKEEAFSEETNRVAGPDSGFREIQQKIISYVRGLPGNSLCCDCSSSNDVTWLSTNYGILVCIECSGMHRDLGVHISRIQSLTLDKVGTAQLLLARHMSNSFFNQFAEATSPVKPEPTSSMDERREFIQWKYVKKKFVKKMNHSAVQLIDMLCDAIDRQDLGSLLNVYFQGGDLSASLTGLNESALHLAIYQENGSSLPMVDFLMQNSGSVDRQTKEGNTPLHYCVIYDKLECMRLLLRVGANASIENKNGKKAIDIAKERHCRIMVEMLKQAEAQNKNMFENVEYDWSLSDDNMTDISDEEDNIRNGVATPEKRMRPTSLAGERMGTSSPRLHRASYAPEMYVAPRPSATNRLSTYKDKFMPPPVSSSLQVSGSLKKRQAPCPPKPSILSPNFYAPPSHSPSPTEPPQYFLPSMPRILSHTSLCSSASSQYLAQDIPMVLKDSSEHLVDTDTESSSPQESHVTLINGRSSESLSSLVSEGDNPRRPPRQVANAYRRRRCRALYDCDADLEDELSFREGEILIILNEKTEDGDWMEGMVEGAPGRRGKIPVNFVHMLAD